jgi:hypothetical protein
MKFNASDTMKRAEEDFGLGKGQYFKVKEGANKIRLLSPCIPYQSEFKGQTNVKFLCWIIDRVDGQIKLYFMPTTILNAIGGLQMSDDFGFEDVPMPYDITIMAKGAGTKEVEYTVVGARQNTPLTEQEQGEFNNKPSIDEVIEKLKEKQSGEQTTQQEAPQTQPAASGYEKARSVADALPGGNRGSQGITEPNPNEVSIDDIPFG